MTPLKQHTNTVFTKIVEPKRQIAMVLTGKIPVTSNRGSKYLFILYEYNIKIILVRIMKVRTASEFIWGFKYMHENLLTRSLKTAYMRLDNKYPPALQR